MIREDPGAILVQEPEVLRRLLHVVKMAWDTSQGVMRVCCRNIRSNISPVNQCTTNMATVPG
eukprot:1520022-Prorocentrum_lima.AAC.1